MTHRRRDPLRRRCSRCRSASVSSCPGCHSGRPASSPSRRCCRDDGRADAGHRHRPIGRRGRDRPAGRSRPTAPPETEASTSTSTPPTSDGSTTVTTSIPPRDTDGSPPARRRLDHQADRAVLRGALPGGGRALGRRRRHRPAHRPGPHRSTWCRRRWPVRPGRGPVRVRRLLHEQAGRRAVPACPTAPRWRTGPSSCSRSGTTSPSCSSGRRGPRERRCCGPSPRRSTPTATSSTSRRTSTASTTSTRPCRSVRARRLVRGAAAGGQFTPQLAVSGRRARWLGPATGCTSRPSATAASWRRPRRRSRRLRRPIRRQRRPDGPRLRLSRRATGWRAGPGPLPFPGRTRPGARHRPAPSSASGI